MSDDDRPDDDQTTDQDTDPAPHPEVGPDPDRNVDPHLDPDLDPGQEERVRALLADLGRDPAAAQMPAAVTVRLEDTLAELTALRAAGGAADQHPVPASDSDSDSATVVPLTRGRRWSSRWAAAAAAVIVLGAGGVTVAGLDLLGAGSPSADDASAGGAQSEAESLDDSGSEAPQTAPSLPGDSGADQRSLVGTTLPDLRSSSFADDAASLLQAKSAAPRGTDGSAPDPEAQEGREDTEPSNPACPGPTSARSTAGEVQRLTVTYDGRLATLLERRPAAGTRLVEAWTCTGDRLLDRARLPAP